MFMQKLTILARRYMLDHKTIQFRCLVLNSQYDSVYFVLAVSVLLERFVYQNTRTEIFSDV